MTFDHYRELVMAQLDSMRTAEKDAVLIGFVAQLYPKGDPDHPVEPVAFLAEAVRLLAAFHPTHIIAGNEKTAPPDGPTIPEF